MSSSIVTVKVKFGKDIHTISLDTAQPVSVFKSQLQNATGVPSDGQKIMGLPGGILKDDADFSKMGNLNNKNLMLMGSIAEKVNQANEAAHEAATSTGFAEDVGLPRGLVNLGNTCYMNSVIQVLRYMPEIRKIISSRAEDGEEICQELDLVFKELDKSNPKHSGDDDNGNHSGGAVDATKFFQAFLARFPQPYSTRFPSPSLVASQGLLQHDPKEFMKAILVQCAQIVNHDNGNNENNNSNNTNDDAANPPAKRVIVGKIMGTEGNTDADDRPFLFLPCSVDDNTRRLEDGLELAATTKKTQVNVLPDSILAMDVQRFSSKKYSGRVG